MKLEKIIVPLVTELLDISSRNRFFPEICTQTIVDLLKFVQKATFTKSILPPLVPLLSRDPTDFLPETVLLWAKLVELYSVRCSVEIILINSLIYQSILHS